MKTKILCILSFVFLSFSVFAIIGKLKDTDYCIATIFRLERNALVTKKASQKSFFQSTKRIPANSNIRESLKKNDDVLSENHFQTRYEIPSDIAALLRQKDSFRFKSTDENINSLAQNTLPNFFDNEKPDILAKKITDTMTYEELLAQCLMFGWAGQDLNAKISGWVDGGLGSIKIFGWNTESTEQVSAAIYELQRRAILSRFSIPLFVASDQEGGRVRHVRGLTSISPSALAAGSSGLPRDAFFSGYFIGRELSEIGINVNFAPVVDLYTDYNSSIIATRSFGENPHTVAILARQFSKGLNAASVLSTAKHFPGHGETSLDSHGILPHINISKKTFYERELLPFKLVIQSGIPFIMAGHLHFPQFMKANEPVTFSKKMLKDILRDELGFQGLLITDDMMMLSALNYAGNFSNAIKLALKAGNNIIESSRTPSKNEAAWYENIYRMKSDKTFFETVKKSAEFIILKKLEYFKGITSVKILPDYKNIKARFPVEGSQKFFLSFAARAIGEIDNSNVRPIKLKRDDAVLFVSDYQNLLKIAKDFFPMASTTSLADASLLAKKFDKIVFCIYDKSSRETFKNVQKSFPKKKYFLVSATSPIFLKALTAERILLTYSYSDFSFIALCSVLAGDFVPGGKIPLENFEL